MRTSATGFAAFLLFCLGFFTNLLPCSALISCPESLTLSWSHFEFPTLSLPCFVYAQAAKSSTLLLTRLVHTPATGFLTLLLPRLMPGSVPPHLGSLALRIFKQCLLNEP